MTVNFASQKTRGRTRARAAANRAAAGGRGARRVTEPQACSWIPGQRLSDGFWVGLGRVGLIRHGGPRQKSASVPVSNHVILSFAYIPPLIFTFSNLLTKTHRYCITLFNGLLFLLLLLLLLRCGAHA